ncbi:MAG: hypothetical protein K9J12_04650 [Melioribacteraceae bacterium]|nr:hypothetical protein [Melioribacteraceae bacterium]MCF8265039.1 hypothetical protein [Melioribacteraceae bacterium]MCF8431653.1 hypothetical protein [Melioribacteraceae bacterium]
MRRRFQLLVNLVFLFTILSCGNESSELAESKLLGAIPRIADEYTRKTATLEKEKQNATDIDELVEFSNELELMENEAKSKIEQAKGSLNLPIEVPFEVKSDIEDYSVVGLQIFDVRFNDVEIHAKIKSNVTREHIFGYLQAADGNGKVLPVEKNWIVLAAGNWRDLKVGEEAVIKGYYRGIQKLAEAEKFIFKSREEWEKDN